MLMQMGAAADGERNRKKRQLLLCAASRQSWADAKSLLHHEKHLSCKRQPDSTHWTMGG